MSVNHFEYVCSVFSYTAYPTVVIEIDCFRENGSQSNCYRYNFTWASAADYTDWLVVARSLDLSGTTAKRLTGMFDALNKFLRIGPLTFNGTHRGTWTQTAKFAGPCPSAIDCYFAFEQTSGNFLDSASAGSLARGSLISSPGIILEGVFWPGVFATASTASIYHYSSATSHGVTVWGWCHVDSTGGLSIFAWGPLLSGAGLAIQIERTGVNTFLCSLFSASGAVNFTATFSNNTWHFFAGVYDPVAGKIFLYIDNIVRGNAAIPGSDFHNANYLFEIFGLPANSNMGLDECGFTLSVAATSGQLAALWNGGAGVTWPAVNSIF